jgi:hypothetical protein
LAFLSARSITLTVVAWVHTDMAPFSAQPLACREFIDGSDAGPPSCVTVMDARHILIFIFLLIGDDGYGTPVRRGAASFSK